MQLPHTRCKTEAGEVVEGMFPKRRRGTVRTLKAVAPVNVKIEYMTGIHFCFLNDWIVLGT